MQNSSPVGLYLTQVHAPSDILRLKLTVTTLPATCTAGTEIAEPEGTSRMEKLDGVMPATLQPGSKVNAIEFHPAGLLPLGWDGCRASMAQFGGSEVVMHRPVVNDHTGPGDSPQGFLATICQQYSVLP